MAVEDRKATQGTAITTLAATDKFYIIPAAGTVPWGYITGANLAGYISAGAGTAMYPTGAFVTGGYLYFNGGTVLTDSNVLSASGTVTLTNKRITPRITTITSSATPTINTDDCDCVTITALAAAITSMTTNLSGTPTNFQKLLIRIKDDGTARAITWGTSFQSGSATLPTTTVLGKTLMVGLIYDSVDSKWTCEATGSRT